MKHEELLQKIFECPLTSGMHAQYRGHTRCSTREIQPELAQFVRGHTYGTVRSLISHYISSDLH
jgi:hypothetical protein